MSITVRWPVLDKPFLSPLEHSQRCLLDPEFPALWATA